MPIILEDNDAAAAKPQAASAGYSPKDYNSVLTGNGVNQGLLRAGLSAMGSDTVSSNALAILIAEGRGSAPNVAHHVHDDLVNYTVLWQDISLCGSWEPGASLVAPISVMEDDLAEFTGRNGTVKIKSRLFVSRLYVYKGTANYVLGSYILLACPEDHPSNCVAVRADALRTSTAGRANLFSDLYAECMRQVNSAMWPMACTADNSKALAEADRARSMYDLVMSELAILKTPGTLKSVLQAASASGWNTLFGANKILSLVNLPLSLYQSDILDVMNARKPEEAIRLKNANMSLSLADTLSSMQGSATAVIPELVGKHYTTKQVALTTEQTAAIESPTKITVVAAGAGTGKSSCIMHRLAFMEENGCDMKQTFVLSFTKAAAGHIRKNFKDCKSSTIAEFTHNFVNVILDDGTRRRVDIVAHSDFVQKLKIRAEDLQNAGVLQPSTEKALDRFISCCERIEHHQSDLLDMLDLSLNPEANNILSVLKLVGCTSLEIDPIIFHTQLSLLKPNIEHIVIDESQDSNRLEFLTMLRMAMLNNISIYIVGDCAQTLYEFRDADPRILNNLTKLFSTYDLSINHRSTQIILDVANLMSSTMSTHSTTLRANRMMQITKQAVDATVTMNTYEKVTDPDTLKILDDWLELHLGQNQSIAVIARAGQDVIKLYDYLSARYGSKYTVQNITSQRRNDIVILSAIGRRLPQILPAPVKDWPTFESAIRDENIRLNAYARGGARYRQNGPSVNKITNEWLASVQADGPAILAALNDPAKRDQEIRDLQMSLLDMQTERNNILQRLTDSKNAKLKEEKADIVVCTVHGVKGLEYDHVACFINTEAGRNSYSTSDENKRIAYVALTRAKLTECVFCTREKLLKDFEAYRAAQP